MSARRLRIAFVADTFEGWIGGGVVAGRMFVERLREEHDVVVISADELGPDQVKLPGFYLPVKAMRELRFRMARPNREKLARTFADVDIVHLQFPFWLSFVAREEARLAGRPVVAGFHVQPENALRNVGLDSQWACRWAYRLWVQRFYSRADAVICPSPFAERKLRQHGFRGRAEIISNGVPPGPRASSPEDAEDAIAERPRDALFLVMMVGRLAAEKRPELLLEAVLRSRHRHRIRVVLAGAGPRHAALARLAKKLPNGAEVGFLPRARLEHLLKEADLFVHCSDVELEGIAVLEAMNAGLPVLVANSSESAASSLALDERFRFPSGDAEALAAKLDALIEAPDLLREARTKYRALAGKFDFENSVEKLIELYRSLLPPSPARPVAPSPMSLGARPLGA